MDDDLARAIALSLQEQSKEDDDLKRAIELSQQTCSGMTNRKRKASTDVVEILSSADDDDKDMDSDLKMAIEMSRTINQTEQHSEEHLFQQKFVDEDRELALKLQTQFNAEINKESPADCSKHTDGNNGNLLDPEWEVLDPNPDIHALFVQFDKRFFWSSLGSVELEWSKRMYTCAGICYYQKRGFAEKCNIRLSQPLLALRPRGDLVNTLIHEMIHAFLFVTHSDRDRDGHGPRFQSHMHRINQAASTTITIYHEWHEETDYYKKHIWRCDGPCHQRKPFFGFVKRVSNRAPGPNDRWWEKHKAGCSGKFIKVGEPTPRKKEKKKRKAVDARQPLVTSWMSNATPAHVSHTAASPISSTHSHHVLGGKKTGVSRLLQPKEKITSIENGKQYRMADLFSSDDET